MTDKSLKKIQIDLLDQKESEIQKKPIFKHVLITENDIIDLDATINGKKQNVYGQIIKIGSEDDNIYITVILYNYYEEQNVLMIYINDIIKINNINRKNEPISFANVMCTDESVILLRYADDVFEFSGNGKDWIQVKGSGGTATISNKDIAKGFYNCLTTYGLTVEFDTFMTTLADLINTFAKDDSTPFVVRNITDLDGHVILAGDDI